MKEFLDRNRAKIRTVRDYTIGWFFALVFWGVVRNVGVTVEAPVTPELFDSLRMVIIFTLVAGFLFGNANYRLEKYLYRRVPLWRLTIVGIFSVIVIMMVIYILAYLFFQNVIGFNQPISFADFMSNPNAYLLFFYAILVNIVIDLFRNVNLFLGKGNLVRLIKGDFYSPRVENE